MGGVRGRCQGPQAPRSPSVHWGFLYKAAVGSNCAGLAPPEHPCTSGAREIKRFDRLRSPEAVVQRGQILRTSKAAQVSTTQARDSERGAYYSPPWWKCGF